ncbi:DUF4214 domain-containing protein [Ruegeria sp. TM1040]|uniref:DUF4214 domain-containing protein n=1 Tax=Ruegeria sp. (strain TM1040) TaxID=292414 RepID=UPI00140F5ED4
MYPFLTTPDVSSPTSFITSVYANLFNRAPDADGLAFWEGQLSSGAVSAADAIDAIIKGATTAPDSTILTNKNAVGLDFATDAGNTPGFTFDLNGASGSAAKNALAGVTDDAATVTAAQAATDAYLSGVAGAGDTLSLTTGVDNITGTVNQDTIKAVVGAGATLSAADVVDGGAGTDTLELVDATGGQSLAAALLNVSNVEELSIRSVGQAKADTSGTAFTSVNITQATSVDADVNAATNVGVSGVTGAIAVDGGKDITITDANDGANITVGGATAVTGAVTVTDTKVGNAAIEVNGGTTVTVNATGSSANNIKVGGATTTDQPSGAVSITSAHAATAGKDVTSSAITTVGGSSVTITSTADTSKAAADTKGATLTQGDVSVTGGASTTEVTVNQAANVSKNAAVVAVAAKASTQKLTFTNAAANDVITLTFDTGDTLVFTASKALTATEVATAFANLAKNATEGSAPVVNGVYTNGGTIDQGWTSGAVTDVNADDTSASVTFSNEAAGPTALVVANGGTGTATAATLAAGTAATAAETGRLGVIAGKVTIDGNITGDDVLKTVTIDAYEDGSTVKSDALETLTLKNADEDIVVTTASTGAITLNLDAVAGNDAKVSLDGNAATVTGLTINATGTKSDAEVTADAATTVTVNAAVDMDLTGSSFDKATKMVVTGAGKVTLDGDDVASVLAEVDASGATGDVDASGVALTAAGVYTGGSGADTFTVTAAATKASTGGDGDDVITVSTLGTGGSVDAGAGTDTLVMAADDAETASATAGFKATNFEKLSIGAVADATAGADTETVNLANLAFTEVTSAGAVDGDEDILALTNAASGLTLNITGEGLFTVGVKDAATNKTDVLNIASNSDGNLALGTVTAANVETININAVDKVVDTTGATDAFGAAIGDGKDDNNSVQTLTVDAGAATTVNVSGSADLDLTVNTATALTAVNASTATGAVTYTANDGTTTVTGGSGNDNLTAAGDSDVLLGGAGNDKLTAATLTTLTGGEGNDTFVMSGAVDATKYSTITDLSSGDTIDTDATAFNSSKVVLAANATFAQYLDAAIVATAAQDDAASWFQFGGNTFIVNEGTDASVTYNAAEDGIIGITGLVDLSAATFNATNGTFDIA